MTVHESRTDIYPFRDQSVVFEIEMMSCLYSLMRIFGTALVSSVVTELLHVTTSQPDYRRPQIFTGAHRICELENFSDVSVTPKAFLMPGTLRKYTV